MIPAKNQIQSLPLYSRILGYVLGGIIFAALALGVMGVMGYLLPMIAAGFAFAGPIDALTTSDQGIKNFSGGRWPEALRSLIFFPVMAIAMISPGRLVMWAFFYAVYYYQNGPAPLETIAKEFHVLFFWPPFELITALIGLGFGIIATSITIWLIVRQARQVENIATSKTRSAALGLSEFKGVARPVEDAKLAAAESAGSGFEKEFAAGTAPILFWGKKDQAVSDNNTLNFEFQSRFYLEDDTGRILVDPEGASFWDGGKASFIDPVRKILLTRRVREITPGKEQWPVYGIMTRELLPDDPIYVLGNVEVNERAPKSALGTDRLIVRACTEPVRPSLFNWLFFNNQRFLKSRDYRYVFLISDSPEHRVVKILRKGITSILIPGTIWTASALALLYLALKLN